MRSLRRFGLVPSLLIVGVLGGLLAPASSEASSTSLTLQVDSGTPVNILGGAVGCPTGFTSCFAVGGTATGGNPSRSYTVSAAPGLSPRLNMTDITTTDQAKLTGIKIAPVVTNFPSTEAHVLKIVFRNIFDAGPNPAGFYVFAMRTGGYFAAGGTPLNTQYDFVEYKGTGTFCAIATCSPMLVNVPLLSSTPSTVNRSPLSLQVGNAVTTASFTLNQVVQYPTFNCKNAANKCTPDITLTYTITFRGSDFLVLSDSKDVIGVSCNLIPPGPPLSTPAIPCHGGGKKSPSSFIGAQFALDNAADNAAALAAGAVPGTPCTVDCPGVTDVGNTTGTITITKNTSEDTSDTFQFTIDNDGPIATASIPFADTQSEQTVVTVNAGPGYNISEDAISGWSLDPYADCGGTGGTTGINVPAGGNVNCTFSNTRVPTTGTLTINKHTTQSTYDTFHFTINGGPEPIRAMVSPGGGTNGATTVPLETGIYTILEDTISGWTLDSLSCVPGDGNSFEVLPGGGVTCTAENIPAPILGTLKITKQLDQDCTLGCRSETFTFTVTGPSGGSSTVQPVSVTTDATGHGENTVQVPEGTYNVTEDYHVGGWVLVGSNCSVGFPASVPVPPNGEVNCGFFNQID